MSTFQPNVINLNQRYLSIDLNNSNINADNRPNTTHIVSEKGTAKSYSIQQFVHTIREKEPDAKILTISHRISLAESLAARIKGESYLLYDGANRYMIRTSANLAVCYNSLYRLRDKEGNVSLYDYVILDECEQVNRHSVDDKVDHLALNFSVYLEVCKNAKHLICADADLGYLTSYVMRIIGRVVTTVIRNTFKPKQGRKMYITDNVKLNLHKLYAFLEKNPNENVFVACSSLRQSSGINKQIQARFKGIKTMLVNRDNSQQTDTQIFIRDINKRLFNDNIRVLIASPSLGTGVSIETEDEDSDKGDWCNTVFGFFSGQHGPISTDCLQHICRIRADSEYHIFVDKSARALESSASEIHRLSIEKPIDDGSKVAETQSNNRVFSEFEGLRSEVIASENRDRKNFYNRFLQKSKAEGYDVQLIEVEDFEGEGLTRGEEQKKYIAELIAHAATHGVLSKEQAAQMRDRSDLSKDERLTLKISDIAHTMLSSDKVDLYKDIETYIKKKVGKALVNNGALLTADKKRLAELDRKQLMTEDVWRHDVAKSILAPKAMLLQKIFKYIPSVEIKDNKVTVNPDKRFTNESIKTEALTKFLGRNKDNLKTHLNITVNKSTLNQPINLVRNLIESCGLSLDVERVGRGKESERFYNVSEQSAKIVNSFAESGASTSIECRIKHKPAEDVTTSLETIVVQTPATDTCQVAKADTYEAFITHISKGVCDKDVAQYLYSPEDYELQKSGKTRHTLDQLQTYLQANSELYTERP